MSAFPHLSKLRFSRVRQYLHGDPDGPRATFAGKVLPVLLALAVLVSGTWLMGGGMVSYVDHALIGLTLLVLGVCGWQLLRVVAPDAATNRAHWVLMLVMFLTSLLEVRLCNVAFDRFAAFFLTSGELDGAHMVAYPNAVVPFLVAMLYGGPAALVIGVITSAAVAIAPGETFNLNAFLMSLCATCLIVREAPKIGRRAQMWRVVLRVGLLQLALLLIILHRQGGVFELKALQVGAFYAYLVASVLVCALLLLPFAEYLTKRSSNITVARFADLESPLLRRLSLEAPGTYHHAMMVGDLAQAAAEKIGANGVLARVGAYYHDIGKLGHPHYYTENQSGVENPHDDLPPNISRMVIMNHVKEGLVLAQLGHLPRVLRRFIATHHGTSVVRWFLVKERKRLEALGMGAGSLGDLDGHFRYPGPLPVTREETIVSLADSVEAASRAMRFYDRAKIEALVNDIVRDRWTDGQLDKSELTGAELNIVRDSLTASLVHLLHGRLPYPPQK